MKISTDEVLHVAQLARLEIEPAAMEKMATQVGTILDYINSLNQVDTEGVPPTSHAIALTNAFREDHPGEHLGPDKSLANAPEADAGAFIVPKVIE
ncbi:MAG: Asp-tRNA(Asn)/Glu-tRNA(Gln) amidotransferase subunit GatC [Desulfosarcinaceae bacterium]|nr:Asp-tRNA(Asn)/Glu-tRNA(Gln) amidotransferase subunit GatC [Desulfosarcinaceae bacterium]